METKPIHYGFLYDLFVKKPTLQWHRDVDDILLCARYCKKKNIDVEHCRIYIGAIAKGNR